MARERGLYESLVTAALRRELAGIDRELVLEADLARAEAADRLALHLARIVRRAVEGYAEDRRVAHGTALARRLIEQVVDDGAAAASDDQLEDPARVLHAVLRRSPDGRPESVTAPLIPLLDTTLLTNAPGEPHVGSQLQAEIDSADRIDVVMAFVRRSGLLPLRAALRRHCEAGGRLRLLTTTYTGTTELRALQDLADLGAEVQVSYDLATTRLHAKAWLFHRDSGYSTAYVGSSNLTHSAQVDGLEWNLRVSAARNPDVVAKIAAVFEGYWQGGDFEPFDADRFVREHPDAARPTAVRTVFSAVEVRLEPFQERLLEQIQAARTRGRHRNLLVAATGTGKTVMAAVDYARLRDDLPRARLLFVAHRREILEQALATYRHKLRDPTFGELWLAGERPRRFEHVFASVQSLQPAQCEHLDAEHFDVVVVDEFHHAAAATYRTLLQRLQPRELLGLTATPDRSDGLDVLHWFDGRIAAELRLWDAIDQHRLVPFHYYGIHDGADLRNVTWRRGHGYDVGELERVLTADETLASRVAETLRDHAGDVSAVRALGFCVSIGHAEFMAAVFRRCGIPAMAISARSPDTERRGALAELRARRITVLFSVDLFNEGVDVPEVDTLLLLRPTQSATLFLQQLGRGLRRADGKHHCLVLDFVGNHRREFRFDLRLRGLLGGTRRDVRQQVERGFPFLPAGCHLHLDDVAQRVVLDSLKNALPSSVAARAEELRAYARTAEPVTLRGFLEASGLELGDIYPRSGGTVRCFADLLEAADLHTDPRGPAERTFRGALRRMLHADDVERLTVWRELLAHPDRVDVAALPMRRRRLAHMLVAQLGDRALGKHDDLATGWRLLADHPQVCAEMHALCALLENRIDHVHERLSTHPEVPLQIHARYTRLEILAACGDTATARIGAWQTGVRHVAAERADLLAFTLDKSDGNFSPTTRYRDYAITPELIHWESQSQTRADSDVGRRYREHAARGSHVLLFARLRQDERAFWFLGPAHYVRHEGERPMAITWKLERPLPGDLFARFAAAIA